MSEQLAPGISRIPLPWNVKGQGWIFPVYTPFSPTPITLPAGSYSSFEAGTSFDQSSRFHGGVGMVMVVRYLEGPAGPYDELLWIPGLFSKSKEGTEGDTYFLTTTRIYVSTDASVANQAREVEPLMFSYDLRITSGRKEWGIPKHRAIFTFRALDAKRVHLTVSHPTLPSPEPFFSAILIDSQLTPFSVPVSTSWLTWRIARPFMNGYEATLIQPPLPSARDDPEKAQATLRETNQTVQAFTGSDGKTLAFTPSSTGWSKLSYLEVSCPEGSADRTEDWTSFGDGKGFPKFQVAKEGIISGKGIKLTCFEMHIPGGVVVSP